MTAATIYLKADGSARQPLAVFDLPVKGRTSEGAQVVGVEEILRGLAYAMRNQIDGLRQQGVPEPNITRLLVDVWPFKEEEA